MGIATAPLPPRPRPRLTRRQAEVLRALAAYQRSHGYPPAIRELGLLLGIHSPSSVVSHLVRLERLGYIHRTPRIPRAISLLRHEEDAPPDGAGGALRAPETRDDILTTRR
jgi:repressor LexA